MISKEKWTKKYIIASIFIILFSVSIFSKEYTYLPLNIDKISSYINERVVFQHVEQSKDVSRDNSYEALLIIKDHKMYLIADGYDNIFDVNAREYKASVNKTYSENMSDLLWTNKINGKPDFIQIMDRRNQVIINSNEEFVSTNFGTFYKEFKIKYIKEHVVKYRQILKNRKDSDLIIERKQIPGAAHGKNSILVKAKSFDDVVYTCEDADGDGITETFTVHLGDGFHWGYKSGSNMMFIYQNTDKEIENLIGKLSNEAVFGSVEDEKSTIESFPKTKELDDLVKSLIPLDPNTKK